MEIEISFTRELTLAAVDGIAQYYEIVESQLQSAKAEERQRIHGIIKGMGLNRDDEVTEWDIAMQEHEMTFEMLLPNFFRYSCIVLLFLVVENKLGEICKAAKQAKEDMPPPPHPERDVIKEYKKYLNQVGTSGLRWDAIHDLNKVRNCIVHASGRVKGSQYETYLRQLAKSEIGISISGDSYNFQDGLQPLYLEDDMLMLKPEYCRQVIRNVRDFFEKLCDVVPLPRLTIKSESNLS
jgi:hypothetical protein